MNNLRQMMLAGGSTLRTPATSCSPRWTRPSPGALVLRRPGLFKLAVNWDPYNDLAKSPIMPYLGKNNSRSGSVPLIPRRFAIPPAKCAPRSQQLHEPGL